MPDSGGPLIGPEDYDVSSPVWVFSPVRIAADSIHIPFCVDSTNSSNALPLQPGFELKEGLLQRHSLPLQLHDATATVLGVNPTKWQERFIQLTPARLGYSLEPPTPPSADGPKLRRKLSFSRKRSDKVDLDGRCALYISRVDPRVFGLRLADGKLLVFSAYSNGEGLMWLVALASAIATHRSAEPSHAAFEEVVVRDGQLRLPTAGGTEVVRAPPLADLVRAGQLERVTVTAEAAAALRFGLKHDEVFEDRYFDLTPDRLAFATEPPASPSGGAGGKLRRKLSFSRKRATKVELVECAVFVAMGDPTVFALRHGDGRLLVMRAHAELAREWAIDLAACVAAAQGRPLVPSPVLRSQEASAPAEPAPPPPPRRSAPPDDPPPLQDRLSAPSRGCGRSSRRRAAACSSRGLRQAAAAAGGGRAARAQSGRPPARPVQREPTQRAAGAIVI